MAYVVLCKGTKYFFVAVFEKLILKYILALEINILEILDH